MVQVLELSTGDFKILNRAVVSYGMARAFGEMIRARLEERGWSMRDFAARLDRKRSVDSLNGYVSKIVNGKVRPPLDQIEKWADHLRFDGAARERFLLYAKLACAPEDVEESFLQLLQRVERLEEAARAQGLLPER